MNKLHLRIREARDLTGLTQQTLADELGVTRAAVAHWESPTGSAPTVQRLVGLARRSGLHFEYLATGRGPRRQGAPLPVAEQPPAYAGLDERERRLLERFRTLSPGQRDGLLALLADEATRRRR